MAGLKATSGYAVNQHLKRTGRFWQPAFHDRALRADDDRIAIARYIVGNPIRAELVSDLKDYPFWNAVYLYTDPYRSIFQGRHGYCTVAIVAHKWTTYGLGVGRSFKIDMYIARWSLSFINERPRVCF